MENENEIKPVYYDGTKLLSMKDINNKTPEIYLSTGNRTSGKTTYFNRLAMNRFLKQGKKFGLLYRFNYELDSISDKFFKDIKSLFFQEWNMVSVSQARGIYHKIYLTKGDIEDKKAERIECGYAISFNSADQIKKVSHLFTDIDALYFDEFQSETDHYCDREVTKFQSVHTSIARGQGKQYRPVPVYMIANLVSLINPYYVALGISSRLQKDTKFLRGDGWVLEVNMNETASLAQQNSAFNRAFKNDEYNKYAAMNVYLNDNIAFVEKPQGKSRYLITVKYDNTLYAVREFTEIGIIYVDTKIDTSFKDKITISSNDHEVNYIMLRRNDMFRQLMRYYFMKGCVRFRDLRCKEMFLKLVTL